MISLWHQESLMSGHRTLRNLASTRLRQLQLPLNLYWIRCKKEKTGRVGLDNIARLPVRLFVFHCNASFQVSLKRRELLKPDLSKNFRCVLFPVYASVSLSFWRWVKQKCWGHHESQQDHRQSYAQERERIGKTNVLFLRDRFTTSRRGRYNYSFNKVEFSRGKPILASFVEN